MLVVSVALPKRASQNTKEAKVPECKGNPKLVGDCLVVHGRMTFANGSHNVRIWPIGTRRLLGVQYVPGSITKRYPDGAFWMPTELSDISTFGVDIFGDFEVCPLSRKTPGAMQFVCVESAKNLVVKDYNKEPTRIYRIHDATSH